MTNQPPLPPCAAGCTIPLQHKTTCADRDADPNQSHVCTGCLPAPVHANTSTLCQRCHLRLSATLADVPGQHRLLVNATRPSTQLNVRPQPTHGHPNQWPTASGAARYMHVRGTTHTSPHEGEPVRIDCLDTAAEMQATLAAWVNAVTAHTGQTGPTPLTTQATRDGRANRPPSYHPVTAARWLRRHLLTAEGIPDAPQRATQLRAVMAKAHALQPWHPQTKRIRAIPCPYCEHHTLAQQVGRDTVTCTNPRCRQEIPQGRYLIWARQYEEARA